MGKASLAVEYCATGLNYGRNLLLESVVIFLITFLNNIFTSVCAMGSGQNWVK